MKEQRNLAAERQTFETERAALLQAQQALTAAQKDLAAEIEALSARSRALNEERNILDTAKRDMAKQQEIDKAERDRLLAEYNAVLEELDTMKASRIWKLSAPLRKLSHSK